MVAARAGSKRDIRPRIREVRSRLCAAAVWFGLLVRVATLPLPGHDDVITWKIWSYAATENLTGMYGVGGTPPERGIVRWGERWSTVDYPPFFLYEYGLVGRVFKAIFPDYPDGLRLLVAIKLPVLLANAALAWLLFATVRRVTERDDAAWWAALAYWLNPATMFGGEMLGYVDPLLTLPAMCGLVLAWTGRRLWAGVLIAIAVATKPQAVLIGPAFALLLWQTAGVSGIVGAGAAFMATLAAVALPFAMRGAMGNMWLAFGSFVERRDTMSAFAANVGWLINWALRSSMGVPELGWRAYLQVVPRPLAISRFEELGYPNPRPFCAVIIAGVVAWAMWMVHRTKDLAAIAALGAFTVHAFFVLNVGMHESHQLFEIPLLVLAAALRPGLRPLLVAVSAIVTLNINFYYGISLGWGWAIPRQITGIDVSVVLAFLNVATLAWFATQLTRLQLEEPWPTARA
jgi:Glycosyltransferase family 87